MGWMFLIVVLAAALIIYDAIQQDKSGDDDPDGV